MSEVGGGEVSFDGFPETKKAAVFSDLEIADKKLDTFRSDFDNGMQKRFGKIKDTDNAFVEEVFRVVGSGDKSELAELKENTLDDRRELVNWIEELNNEFNDLVKTRDYLDGEYAQYLHEEVETEVLDIVPRINFAKALDSILTNENILDISGFLNNVSYVREVQNDVVSDSSETDELSSFQLTNIRDRLRSIKSDFKEKGYLNDGVDGDYDFGAIEDEPNMVLKSVNLKSDVNELSAIVSDYKNKSRLFVWGSGAYASSQINILTTLSDKLSSLYSAETYSSEEKVKRPDPRLLTAIEGWIEKQKTVYEKNGIITHSDKTKYEKQKYYNGLDKDAIIAAIDVVGFDNPNISFKTESVRAMLKAMVPASVLGKVTSIEIIDGKASDSPRYAGRSIEETSMVAGTCFYDFDHDKGELVGAAIEVYSTDDLGKLSDTQNRHTIWHEVGHVAHQDMALTEISEWQDILGSEKFRLTTYVPHEGELKPLEDFTETFTYFVDQPTLLKVLAPKRYDFMKRFFENRSSEDEKSRMNTYILITEMIQDAQWKSQNLSPEEIREIWAQTVPQV